MIAVFLFYNQGIGKYRLFSFNRNFVHCALLCYESDHCILFEIAPSGFTYRILKSNDVNKNLNAINKFYLYAILENDPLTPLWETERDYNQIIIYRDRVRPGECEGRGIGIDLLPTIRDLNRIIEYSRKSLAFKANPPLFYDADKYFNPHVFRKWSGAMIARNPNGRNPLEALQMPEYPEVLEHIRDLRQIIRDAFQVDPIGEVNTPVKSATEVSIRENRAQRTSATDISRLINELPKQVFTISAKILAKRRLLSKDRSISDIKSHLLRFDFQSPLYDLQKQDDLSHFTMMAQILQQFGGEGAVLTATKMEEVLPFLADKLNLPTRLMKSKEELLILCSRWRNRFNKAK
ncbi:MAG TPA: portal protein [Candidatus Aquirickettsiella sp.]|jgi:hypothetical protein